MLEIGAILLGALIGAGLMALRSRRPLQGGLDTRAGAAPPPPPAVEAPPRLDPSLAAARASLAQALEGLPAEERRRPETADIDRSIAESAALTLQLIRLRNRLHPTPSASPATTAAEAGGSETVLVVEDDSSIRSIVRRTLERRGYAVMEAGDPLQALALLEDEHNAVDLLLSDVRMPHMNGTELVRRVRERWPLVRVLYMSGYAAEPGIARDVAQQGVALVGKPFTPDQLVVAVREALDALPDSSDSSLPALEP